MPAKLQLNLLGAPEVYLHDQALSFETNKSRALLFYLALNSGWHPRDLLAELLWPDMPTTQARKNLRDGLTQLRAAVDKWLVTETQRVEFAHTAPHKLDVTCFVSDLQHGRATRHLPAVEAALRLYRGDFLMGFHVRKAQPFEAWVAQKREELHTYAIAGMEWVAEQYCARQDYQAGLAVSNRLLMLEPWRESTHRLQMQLLAFDGDRSGALQQYERCRQILNDELGVSPAVDTVTLYAQIKREQLPGKARAKIETSTLPQPTKSTGMPKVRHNLPAPTTTLIGRTQELAYLRHFLDDPERRLLTIVGFGGVGKTRLAQTAIHHLVAQPDTERLFKDGIYQVALTGVSAITELDATINRGEPALPLLRAIADVIGFTFNASEPLLAQLVNYLAPRQLLLLLDNFEHLRALAHVVATILQGAAQVKILITSRERLQLQSEWLLRLEGLPVRSPDEGREEEGQTNEAISLFLQRGQQADHRFIAGASDRQSIQRICHFVGGLPLAIELAAAWLPLLTPEAIAQQLEENYDLLATTARDVPERHRTMQTVLDYSWRLLTPAEQIILLRLSVFRGRFTHDAAASIGQTTLPTLMQLVDKTWLWRTMPATRDEGGDYTIHFELHQLSRQYLAKERAAQPILDSATQAAYATYYAK